MKEIDLSRFIRLQFAREESPGSPIELDKDAMEKLGDIPRVLRAFAKSFGARLGSPILWGGSVHLAIIDNDQLIGFAGDFAGALIKTAGEIEQNSQRTPPLRLAQAASNPNCVEVLRALSTTHEKSGLIASIYVQGVAVDLPQLKPSAFTEPGPDGSNNRFLRTSLIGVCKPKPDANVLLLSDRSTLELPISEYPRSIDELFELVLKNTASYVGPAMFLGKANFRALPNGQLDVQLGL